MAKKYRRPNPATTLKGKPLDQARRALVQAGVTVERLLGLLEVVRPVLEHPEDHVLEVRLRQKPRLVRTAPTPPKAA